MSTKAQLQKQLANIAKLERERVTKKYFPRFKKLEGRFFKEKNYYGGGENNAFWWKYTKVVEINPDDVYDTGGHGVTCRFKGWSFQTTINGDIYIEHIKTGYAHSLRREISETEFNNAWNKAMEKLDNLK